MEKLRKEIVDQLCTVAVGERCERLRALSSEDALTSRVWEEVAIAQDFIAGVSKAGPQPWLLSLLLQACAPPPYHPPTRLPPSSHPHKTAHMSPHTSAAVPHFWLLRWLPLFWLLHPLPHFWLLHCLPHVWLFHSRPLQEEKVLLPEALEDYIASHISSHLDPYIDGDVTNAKEERGTSPMYDLLTQKYQKEHGRELPAPQEVVLALYLRHGIGKSNAYQCFTDLVMGQGRLPIMGEPQTRHCKALGVALADAVAKDFGKGSAKIQGVAITPAMIEQLAKTHSDRLFFDHQKNAERLAEANREGEIGRKAEMKRIFGIEV